MKPIGGNFLVILFAEISALPFGIHWCPIHSLSSLKTPLGKGYQFCHFRVRVRQHRLATIADLAGLEGR